MKAIVQSEYGSTDVLKLEELEKPMVADNEVLVRVHGAGVHAGDWHLRWPIMLGMQSMRTSMGLRFRN